MTAVVYQILNVVNGKRYIGSTVNWKRRRNTHCSGLRNGVHKNTYLQNSWNKYGEQSFTFSVIEACVGNLVEREQYYIDTMRPEYNLSPTAGSTLGCKLSDKTREKMSVSRRGDKNGFWGKTHTPEVRKILADSRRKMPKEQRDKLSELIKGENNPGFQKGELHKRAILTEKGVAEIKVKIAQGDITQRAIAQEYNVSPAVITDIKMGRRWAHVG